jgi:hypothetical protein
MQKTGGIMKATRTGNTGFYFLLTSILIVIPFGAIAQSGRPFVPKDFQVPEKLETERFRLRMLTVNDVVKDYDAVMTSVEHLRGVFGPRSTWPKPELTLEQDLIDLGWHQKEFQTRRSFAYTVMDPPESECLGCVYIVPTRKRGYDAEVYLWVRKSEVKNGLDAALYNSVKSWVEKKWPFKKVAYPGREIEWEAWESLPE